MEERLEHQDQTIQQMQGDVLQTQDDVQAVFQQLNDLSFKFSTMFANWQQQKGQNQSSSLAQNRGEHELVVGSRGHSDVNLKPIKIDVPRFEEGDPQGWIFKVQQYFDFHNASDG